MSKESLKSLIGKHMRFDSAAITNIHFEGDVDSVDTTHEGRVLLKISQSNTLRYEVGITYGVEARYLIEC